MGMPASSLRRRNLARRRIASALREAKRLAKLLPPAEARESRELCARLQRDVDEASRGVEKAEKGLRSRHLVGNARTFVLLGRNVLLTRLESTARTSAELVRVLRALGRQRRRRPAVH